ncbi:Uncharacterized protein FWK35_00031939, partial [Aphis craccivora]
FKPSGQEAPNQHKLICGVHKPILPEMPKEGDCVEFKVWKNTIRHPFSIYADFESLLMKTEEKKGDSIKIIQKNEAISYSFVVKASEDVPMALLEEYEIPAKPVIYRGEESRHNVARHFVETIVEVAQKIEGLMKTNIPLIMTEGEEKTHQECRVCNLCKCSLAGGEKVRDHDHLTGKFRQTLCSRCNLELQQPKFVPVFFHNLSNYDSHFIITELGYDTQTINVIPNSEEKFISFSKHISSTFTVRFIDTFRFMASSLSSLAENLITPGLKNFRETAKHFVTGDMPLVTRKGVYPYDYTDSWERLEDTRLPRKSSFYSTLTETGITEDDYEHAKEVWEHFDCKTLGDYSDLYLKIDVLLLADVFENFRDVCMRAYNLDATHYFIAPDLSFDAMLKFTGQKLQLLDGYDMLLMFENGKRDGLVQVSKRYGNANNNKTPGYDKTKDKSWIIYQDCNYLYGWAMSQYMPYGRFNCVEPTLTGLNDLDDTSPIGRVYKVDVSYPKELHDQHNDLPFLPQNSVPCESKVRKLMATFEKKQNYIVHYRNLQQAIKNGLIVEKVHRVIQFNQSDWLAKYIELNTEIRKRAKNYFEKDFFKLMNNAVFGMLLYLFYLKNVTNIFFFTGKTMQSKWKEMKMELVSCERRLQKLINKCTFKHCINYNENLNAVALENKIIRFDKPIYIDKYTFLNYIFAVLDISKTLMYEYHYDVMRKHYVYHLKADDFYKDLLENSNLMDRMDTSDLPPNHPCYTTARKKIPGFFSDEVKGDTMTEFCVLIAKLYAYNISEVGGGGVGVKKIKAKGIRGHVVFNHMTINNNVAIF